MSPESRFRSSTARLAVVYGAVVLVLVCALQGTVYLLTREALYGEIHNVVNAELEGLAEEFNNGGIEGMIDVLHTRTDSWGRIGAVYLMADSSLHPLGGNLTAWPRDVSPVDGQEVQFRITSSDATSGSSHPVWARVAWLPGNHWLLVGTDISESEHSLRRFKLATMWGVGSITALIGLLGWWYSRHTAKRVRDISAACGSIVHSDLSRRLVVSGRGDEFDQLSGTVNEMLARIEQQAVMLRTTFGSVAHDLRTPLYRMRVRLEEGLMRADTPSATRELVAPALDELDRVQRTLGTLLEIARAESGESARASDPVDVAALVREMFDLYLPGMQDHGLQLRLESEGAAWIPAQRQLLAQLIANLLENALKYVPSGGEVRIAVRDEGAQVILEVADNGPGIAAADRGRAQNPFVRLQEAPGQPEGSGLGLSLVSAIVRLHRGEVELQDNHPGLRVVCRFPRKPVA